MAIITVSRQLGAYGDELCKKVAGLMNYRLVTKADIERNIVRLGFPKDKLKKFDERCPGFFMRFTKLRDEYLNCLRTAVLSEASGGDCILMGRGSFYILKDIPNHVALRFVSRDEIRINRIMNQFSCTKEEAVKKIKSADKRQCNFYKNYFNIDVSDPSFYNIVLNTGERHVLEVAPALAQGIRAFVSDQMAEEGRLAVERLVIGQQIVNVLKSIYDVSIDNLSATVEGTKITFHGIASSSVIVEQAMKYASLELPGYEFASDVSVVQDFRMHRG